MVGVVQTLVLQAKHPKNTLFNLRSFSSFSALFNIGDLTLSLYESELATELLPNKITDLSSLSNSGEARSPKLNRASDHRINKVRYEFFAYGQ